MAKNIKSYRLYFFLVLVMSLATSSRTFAATKGKATGTKPTAAKTDPTPAAVATLTGDALDAFITKLAAPTTAKWNANPASTAKALSEAERKRIEEFANFEFKAFRDDVKSLFYPFAGADVFYPLLLFPNVENLYLVALQPTGRLPTSNKGDSIANWYNEIFDWSFFRTIDMNKEFLADGCATAISVGLKAMGYKIDEIVNYKFTSEKITTGQSLSLGLKIVAFAPNGKKVNVFYFKHNLNDANLNVPLFEAFLQNIKPDVTLLKAASFFPHNLKSGPYGLFNKIDDLILKYSTRILQDDSGLPFAQLGKAADGSKWDFSYYGTVPTPISMFADYKQKELQSAVTAEKAKANGAWKGDLHFSYGYQYKSNGSDDKGTTYTSNLLLATKVKPAAAQ